MYQQVNVKKNQKMRIEQLLMKHVTSTLSKNGRRKNKKSG